MGVSVLRRWTPAARWSAGGRRVSRFRQRGRAGLDDEISNSAGLFLDSNDSHLEAENSHDSHVEVKPSSSAMTFPCATQHELSGGTFSSPGALLVGALVLPAMEFDLIVKQSNLSKELETVECSAVEEAVAERERRSRVDAREVEMSSINESSMGRRVRIAPSSSDVISCGDR